MKNQLSKEEKRFIHELLRWYRTRRSIEWAFYHLFLILGGAVIVIVAVFTLQHLNDRTVLGVTLPGFLMGLVLIGGYLGGAHRVRERTRIAAILRKLAVEV